MFGLTPWQQYCLIKCYSEGHDEGVVAAWHGKRRSSVTMAISRAGDHLVKMGLPRPQPYGRGSREDLRACLPTAAGVLTEPPILTPEEAAAEEAANAYLRARHRQAVACHSHAD